MKTVAAIAALAGLASAGANDYYSLIAARSASPIHLQEIHASGQALWIGKETATYCPEAVQAQNACPTPKGQTPITAFGGGDDYLAMAVSVPGGQQVYIDPATGAVGYTIAHSASMPTGAITTGWTLEENSVSGGSLGSLNHEDGLLACPSGDSENVWQIFVGVEGVSFAADCLGFDALTANRTATAAWQYT